MWRDATEWSGGKVLLFLCFHLSRLLSLPPALWPHMDCSPCSLPVSPPQWKTRKKKKPPAIRADEREESVRTSVPVRELSEKETDAKFPVPQVHSAPRRDPTDTRSRRRGCSEHSPGRGSIYPRVGGTQAGSAGRPGSAAGPRILPHPRLELSPGLRRRQADGGLGRPRGRTLSGLFSYIHGISQEGRKKQNLSSSLPDFLKSKIYIYNPTLGSRCSW